MSKSVPFVLSALLMSSLLFGSGPASCAPPPPQKADIKRGAELFDKNTCSQCHLHGSNMIEPTKPLKGPGFAKKFPRDEQIAAIVRKGVPGTGMPSTGKDMLSDRELCDIIAYIRSLTPATAGAPANRKKATAKQLNSP
ncbi:MAG: cytochrome c [Candidatus Obscuribacterales bacterium]|nr:cytochrome c [Candidatus Obscuribacterales bacterium]